MKNNCEAPGLPTVRVVTVTRAGDAFGVLETGEYVYISPTLTTRFGVEEGQDRAVSLVDNHPDHAERGVPYRARFVSPVPLNEPTQLFLPGMDPADTAHEPEPKPEPEPEPDPVASRTERILATITKLRYASTTEIAGALGVDSQTTRNWLDSLHLRGEIVRADVFASGRQVKASKTYWAKSLAAFE